MRFKKPEKGDIKYVKRFAFIPCEVEGETLWLEFYYLKYGTYTDGYGKSHWSSFPDKVLPESLPSKLEKSLK